MRVLSAVLCSALIFAIPVSGVRAAPEPAESQAEDPAEDQADDPAEEGSEKQGFWSRFKDPEDGKFTGSNARRS